MKIGLIIPTHNEEKTIGNTIKKYKNYFDKKKSIDLQIIPVLNGCTDDTEEEIERLNTDIEIIKIKQSGKGLAIKKGFKYTLKRKNSFIGFIDADMAISPKEFNKLIKKIKNNEGVIASRHLKKSLVKPKQDFKRRLLSRVFNIIVKNLFLLNYKDTQCGAKIFSREAIEKILPKIKTKGFVIDIDILYHLKKQDFKIKEIPIKWSSKKDSSLGIIKNSFNIIKELIELRLRTLFRD